MFDPTLTFKISVVALRVCTVFYMGLANTIWFGVGVETIAKM